MKCFSSPKVATSSSYSSSSSSCVLFGPFLRHGLPDLLPPPFLPLCCPLSASYLGQTYDMLADSLLPFTSTLSRGLCFFETLSHYNFFGGGGLRGYRNHPSLLRGLPTLISSGVNLLTFPLIHTILAVLLALFLQWANWNAMYFIFWGAWGSVVVKALRYMSVGPGIDSKRWHLEFILWQLTFPCAPGSTQPLKMSTRMFLGVKTAGA